MMGTSERQLFRARIAWLCKWLLSHVCGGGLFTVNLVCLPAKKKEKKIPKPWTPKVALRPSGVLLVIIQVDFPN